MSRGRGRRQLAVIGRAGRGGRGSRNSSEEAAVSVATVEG